MKTKSPFWTVGLVISLSIVMLVLFYRVYAATTISGSSITTGAINASNNADFTLGASNRIKIDAATTDSTNTTGVLEIDVDANAATDLVAGEDITLTSQGDRSAFGEKIVLASAAPLTNNNGLIGNLVHIAGINNPASDGTYHGLFVGSGGSTNNAADYKGVSIQFNSEQWQTDMIGTGAAEGFDATIFKTAGSGNLYGLDTNLKSTGTSSAVVRGANISLDVSGGSTTSSDGIVITESGASGTVGNGVRLTGDITDGIDVSDSNIVNAINIGQNNILADGPFTIDLNNASADTLTITNSNTGSSALASLSLEGGLTIGNNGTNPGTTITKHLSTTGTAGANGANIGAGSCIGTPITVNGAATGDVVNLGFPSDFETPLFAYGFVQSTNTVVINICNPKTSVVASANKTWRVDVWKH